VWRSLIELDRKARDENGWGRQDMGRRLAPNPATELEAGRGSMIAKGVITQRANDERLPAQTIEPRLRAAHVCTDIGAVSTRVSCSRGGTLLRLC